MRGSRLTPVLRYHQVRLLYRSIMFLGLLALYAAERRSGRTAMKHAFTGHPILAGMVCAVLSAEMLLRFFPMRLESPGSQKIFASCYRSTGQMDPQIEDNRAAALAALLWILPNAVFGVLYLRGVLDEGIMLLLCCFYAVCDIICILFFCPFQLWILKNRCCVTCRIYNWDFPMMATPLFFVNRLPARILCALALAHLLRWEVTLRMHPERFARNTNAYLSCGNCTEKLCTYKRMPGARGQAGR